MSRERAQAGGHEVFGAACEWIGRCASCRFSVGSDLVGVTGLACAKWNKQEAYSPVKPHWKCADYEYEPGAAS